MKNKIYALCLAAIVAVSLLCVPGFSCLEYKTDDTNTQNEEFKSFIVKGFDEYDKDKKAFKVFCEFSKFIPEITGPSDLEIQIYGLDDYQNKEIWIKIFLKKTSGKILLINEIHAVDVLIVERNNPALLFSINDEEIINDIIKIDKKIMEIHFNKEKIFQKEAEKQPAKNIIKQRSISDSMLEFLKSTASEIFPIHFTNKFFIPVDSRSKAPLDGAVFNIDIYNENNIKVFTSREIFMSTKEKQWIEITYPTACNKVLLSLKKEGYEDWIKDISDSFFKKDPEPNTIEMKKKDKRVSFIFEKGSKAKVTIVGISKDADQDGKAYFTIDPYKETGFIITQEGFGEYRGPFNPDQTEYRIKLEPLSKTQVSTSIATQTGVNIPISNEAKYRGDVILTDNLKKNYKYPINQSTRYVEIKGIKINSAQLDPEFLQEEGMKYSIYINKDGNGCKIIPIEEKILNFQFSLKSCGEKRPGKIAVYLDGPLNQYGDPAQKAVFTFNIDPKKVDFQHSRAVVIDPRKSVITASIMDGLERNIPCVIDNNFVDVDIDLCKPALALVVFITNSRKALQKQDVIDQAIRRVFALKPYFKELYAGWVSYNKTFFQLNEFKNSNVRQIEISDENINDTADTSLKKIIKDIEKKL